MFDPLHLHELAHPTAASIKADLQAILVLDVLDYGEKAWRLLTRAGEVWMPVSQLFRDPTARSKRGEVLYAPMWLCAQKFGRAHT